MLHPFQRRLMHFAGAPARRKLQPRRFAEEFVWTRQQGIVGKRQHLPHKWVYTNSERTAYAVNMHLVMRREERRYGKR